MTIQEIEEEFDEPMKDILLDFMNNDYMGIGLDTATIAGALETTPNTLVVYARKNGISFPRGTRMPTHYEDVCWVKYGLTLKEYLKMRSPFLTQKEMAVELGTIEPIIQDRCRRFGIKPTNLASTAYR